MLMPGSVARAYLCPVPGFEPERAPWCAKRGTPLPAWDARGRRPRSGCGRRSRARNPSAPVNGKSDSDTQCDLFNQKLFDLLQFDGMDSPASTRLQKKSMPFQCVLRIFAGRRGLVGLANWGFVGRGRRCARPVANHALKWRTFFSGRPSRGTGRRAGALRPLCVFCGSASNCNKSKSFWLGMRRGGPVVPGGFLRRVS